MQTHRPDPLVSSSRREALFALAVWFAATAYTVGYCAAFGYDQPASDLTFVWGFPSWVFWGIVAPWTVCTVVSIWFAVRFMRDDPLGAEASEASADLAAGESQNSQTASERRDA